MQLSVLSGGASAPVFLVDEPHSVTLNLKRGHFDLDDVILSSRVSSPLGFLGCACCVII